MLACRTANESLAANKQTHPPANLFGDLWKEGGLAILFADTGLGKSILAMQIAESIALGTACIPPSAFRTPHLAPAQKVLYLDFEL